MGIPATIMGLLALAAQQGLNIYQNFWITFWTEDIYIKNATLIHTQSYTDITFYYLGIYALLGVLQGEKCLDKINVKQIKMFDKPFQK